MPARVLRPRLISGLAAVAALAVSISAQAPAPSRADILRGDYGRYRANNDLLFYHLDIRVDPDRKFISGKNTIRFRMLADDTRIQLDLYENLDIEKIVLGDTALEYQRELNAVFVDFPATLERGREYEIEFHYSGHPLETSRFGAVAFRTDPAGRHWVNSAVEGPGSSIWWPSKDQWRDEVESMLISVAVPNDLMDVSNGRFVGKTDLGDGYTRWDWKVHYPINSYNVSINVGKYVQFSDRLDDLTLDFYVLPENLEKARRQFAQAGPMIQVYEKYFGEYPFTKDGYKLIEVPYSGMEHQSAVTYGNRFANGYLERDWTGVGVSLKFDFIIIHESAHEWFGNSVSAADVSDMWIHEGWTTYLEAVYVEEMFGYDDALKYINGYKPKVSNRSPIVTERGIHRSPSSSDQYFKGALFIHTLRSIVNDDARWWAMLRAFYQEFKYQNIMTEDVVRFFNRETGRELTPIFDQYLRRTDIPTLDLRFDEESGTVAYRWKADVAGFDMPIEVGKPGAWEIIQPAGEWQSMRTALAFGEFEVADDLYYVNVRKSTMTVSEEDAALTAAIDATRFRNIGPFRTSAWVTDIAVPEMPVRDHLYTIYAATRTGGLWKTVNNGITWEPISDSVAAAAVGAVAVAPSNPSIVWMGTGDQANARSSYSGTGVYKSTDAGKTWRLMGLPDSHHIARIVIHPSNPEIVYVAAMGHLFSRNEQRGVFRTRNGGKTWEKVLYVDDGTGAIDLVMNPQSPGTLYAAMYEKHRTPWQLTLGGPGSGVYRSDDGGTKWRKLGGLPSGNVGRIGIDLQRRHPNVLTVIVENLNPRTPGMPARVDACRVGAAGGGRGGAPATGGPMGNEVYRSTDGGETWRKTHDDATDVAGSKAPYSFNQIRTNPADPSQIIVTSDSMYESRDGGKTWNCDFFRGVFGDFRTIWWDEQDPQRLMLGSDGGVNVSYDGGRTTDYFLNKRIGEVYAVGVDMDDPYNVYGGLQDHDSWKGPSNGKTGRITLEDWTTVGTGDGMYNQPDPTDSRWVYNTYQAGGQRRFDQRTGRAASIEPRRPQGAPALRYNWVTPIVLSPHNPRIVYTGAQVLFRSLDRGDAWQEISPDLTTGDPDKCGLNPGYVPYCTITSISESPLTPGVIWVGTDDGKVQLTRDHGATWTDLTPAVAAAGGPADRYVSRVFASPHEAGTAFVAKNGFRHDDFRPFLYRTTDFGRTWTAIANNLAASPINVVAQDRRNPNLLIVGNDLGVWVSIDSGDAWQRLEANLPTVPVHDLTIHPRENDLVLGTYGRGLFVGDITHLQELSAEVLAKPLHVFDIEPRAAYGFRALGNFHLYGHKYIEAPNEPDALVINYYLREARDGGAEITVTDIRGDQIAQVKGPSASGLNRAYWNMRPSTSSGRGASTGPGRPGGGPVLPPGDYKITVKVGNAEQTTVGRIRERITGPAARR